MIRATRTSARTSDARVKTGIVLESQDVSMRNPPMTEWRPLENGRLLVGRLTAHPYEHAADPTEAFGIGLGDAITVLARAIPEGWQVLRIKARRDSPKRDGRPRGNRWQVEMVLVQRAPVRGQPQPTTIDDRITNRSHARGSHD